MFKNTLIVLFMVSLLWAEVSLSGKVVDASGSPIKGARLMLVDTGLIAYSKADGSFAFAEQIAVVSPMDDKSVPYGYFFDGSTLQLTSLPQEDISVALFTLQGREVFSRRNILPQGGDCFQDLSSLGLSDQLYILRVRVEQNVYVTKILKGMGVLQSVKRVTRSPRVKRGDKLVTDKKGYIAVVTDITDLSGVGITVTLTANGELFPSGMKAIPTGSFNMGSDHKSNNPDEVPVHSVELTGFYMDSVEVTQAEYKTLMGKEPWVKQYEFAMSEEQNPWQMETSDEGGLGNKLPAWFLTWYDAVLYCNERSKIEGLDTVYSYAGISGEFGEGATLTSVTIDYSKDGYRLPTEAEWEYACRAGSTTEWYWGDDDENNTVALHAWFSRSAQSDTHEVGTLQPNSFGIHDLCGNVVEFCNDYYSGTIYKTSLSKDPIGPSDELETRVVRGGSWNDPAREIRSARRFFVNPADNSADVGRHVNGLRCVRRMR